MTDQTDPTRPLDAILWRNDLPEPEPPGPGPARRFFGRLFRILGPLAAGGLLTIMGIVLWNEFSRPARAATPTPAPTRPAAAPVAPPTPTATSVPPTLTLTAVPTAVPTAMSNPVGRTQPDDVCNVRFRSDVVYFRVEGPLAWAICDHAMESVLEGLTDAEREALDTYTDRSSGSPVDIQWCWVTEYNDQVRYGLFSPRSSPTYVERGMCKQLGENTKKPDSVASGAVYHEAPTLMPTPAPPPPPTAAPTRPPAVAPALPTAAAKPAALPAAAPATTAPLAAAREQTCTLSFQGQQLWMRVTGPSAQALCREFNLSGSAFFDGEVAFAVQCSTTIEGQRVEFMGSGARALAKIRTSVYANEFSAAAPRCAS
jgi:hypothetical protein